MEDRHGIVQHEYENEFEEMELEISDEFEDRGTHGDSEFEGLDELNESSEHLDIVEWEAIMGGSHSYRCEVLDNFPFDSSTLTFTHLQQLRAIATKIRRGLYGVHPIRSLSLIGHTDPAGSASYNRRLGVRRAAHVANELRRIMDSKKPGISKHIRITIGSKGETKPVSKYPARNRRVEICFLKSPPMNRLRVIPPDHSICGVPRKQRELEYETEFEVPPKKPASAATVQSRLCYYQDHSNTSHRNHFRCQAVRWASRISAIAEPDPHVCRKKIGATRYNTGADLIARIRAAAKCTKRPVSLIHVFSHSGSYGVFGTTMGSAGLYYGKLDASSRSSGGRTVNDIPLTNLSSNVVFVLHGCNTAEGPDSFAQALYRHLAKTLKNPKVYGHYNSGCAGRDNSWREFSRAAPTGRRRTSIAPYYSGKGCCS